MAFELLGAAYAMRDGRPSGCSALMFSAASFSFFIKGSDEDGSITALRTEGVLLPHQVKPGTSFTAVGPQLPPPLRRGVGTFYAIRHLPPV